MTESTETPEAPEVTPESKQIRTLDDRLGSLRSGSTDGEPNMDAMGKPPLRTSWDENDTVNTSRIVAPKNNVHDAWWLEDFYVKSDLGTLKSLDGKRTLNSSSSEVGGGNVAGTHKIFNAYSGGTANKALNQSFRREIPGCLQLASNDGGLVSVIMGSIPGKTGNLSTRKALFSCPLGMKMQMDTAGTDVKDAQGYKLKHFSILYKKDNEDIKYGAIVENYTWKNEPRRGLEGNFDLNNGGFDPTGWFGKDEITPGWTKKPSLGGIVWSFISEDEIQILEGSPGYKAVGMIMSWNVKGNYALNIYDLCPVFATGDIPNTKSRRIIQPPMLFSESLNVKSYKLV